MNSCQETFVIPSAHTVKKVLIKACRPSKKYLSHDTVPLNWCHSLIFPVGFLVSDLL